jgi:hypothetical protein
MVLDLLVLCRQRPASADCGELTATEAAVSELLQPLLAGAPLPCSAHHWPHCGRRSCLRARGRKTQWGDAHALFCCLMTDAEVVKVGFSLATDIERLQWSYPHLPCFQR